METNTYRISYRLALQNGSFMETSTNVAANDEKHAALKLVAWLKTTKNANYTAIEYYEFKRITNVIV